MLRKFNPYLVIFISISLFFKIIVVRNITIFLFISYIPLLFIDFIGNLFILSRLPEGRQQNVQQCAAAARAGWLHLRIWQCTNCRPDYARRR